MASYRCRSKVWQVIDVEVSKVWQYIDVEVGYGKL